MTKNVIVYFSTNTKPKVTIFGNESTSIRFYGQWNSRWIQTISQSRRVVHQKLVDDFRGETYFLETSKNWKI